MAGLVSTGKIAIVHDGGGATTWDISFPPSSSYPSWTTVALPAEVTHERPRPICLTESLWFILNVGGFPSPTSKTAGSECNRQMARSQNGGATWDLISLGDETCTTDRAESGDEFNHFSRIVRAEDGRLWAARKKGTTTAHPVRTEVFYSDDDGNTWTLSTTLSVASRAHFPIALLAHPTNANIIVLISARITSDDDRVVVHYTLNRGGIWATNAPTVASGNNFTHTENGQSSRHLLLPNGRLVIANRFDAAAHMTIHTSDDYGLTWTLRYTDAEVDEDNMLLFGQLQWLDDGAHLVGLRVPVSSGVTGSFAVMESTDGGIVWTVRAVPDPSNPVFDNDWDAVYDPVNDVIIAQNDRDAAADRVQRLANAANGGSTWADLTGALPFVSGSMHWEGVALVFALEEEGGGGPPGEDPPVSDSPTGGIVPSTEAGNYVGLCGGIGVFARQPVPPFTVLAGPFYPRSARRLFALSEVETGDIELAIGDISDPAWLLPGACWSIESGCEELWAGFIRPGEVELDSDSVRLSLEGPTALLDLEVSSSDRMHYDAGSAMIDFLLSAQARSTIGVFPGNILRGIAVDTSARGQTLSNFIQSASEEAGIDWHIRAERDGYNGVAFYLDAGDLRRETTTKIVKDDLVAGILRQRPITGSITAFGAAATFEGRNVATVNALATGLLGGNRLSYPPDQSIQNLLAARNIGPAASRHRSLFFERTRRGLEVLVTKRMTQEAFAIDELIVVLDQNDFRDVRIADMISLEVRDWIPGLTVEGRFQVRRSEPNEELEDKDMVLWALP